MDFDKLVSEISKYIEENLVITNFKLSNKKFDNYSLDEKLYDKIDNNDIILYQNDQPSYDFDLDPSFSETLFQFIRDKGLTETDVYKGANLDRKLFSKIRSNKNYKPKKQTVLALLFGLKLNIDEANELLESAGYILSHSFKIDLIIEYLIEKQEYDINKANDILYNFNCPLLGQK